MKKQLFIAAALFLSSSVFGQLTNGLVSQFYFTGGTLQNSVTTSSLNIFEDGESATFGNDRNGNATNALTFNGATGTGSKHNIDNAASEFPLSNDFSISFWFKTNNLNTGTFQIIFSSRQDGAQGDRGGVDCYINAAGEFEVQFRELGTGGQLPGLTSFKTTPISANIWYHVAIVKQGANVKHYINSSESSTETLSNYPVNNFNNVDYWNIGAFYDYQTGDIVRELDGGFDDLRLYSRALSASEVSQLYQEAPPVLSLNENHNNALNIYPNPAQNAININSDTPVKSVSITSLDGKQVYTGQQTNTIDISAFQSGVYILNCILENNQVVMKRIVKQ